MFKSSIVNTLILVFLLNITIFFFAQPVRAEIIGTQKLLEMQQRNNQIDQIDQFLARSEVRKQLIQWGVDPADAQTRVTALSSEELQLVAEQLETLPAGGSVLAVVGGVFVVLLILELVGVTNIFTSL
jgi:hypothetical protein